jgi:hypothetical protein
VHGKPLPPAGYLGQEAARLCQITAGGLKTRGQTPRFCLIRKLISVNRSGHPTGENSQIKKTFARFPNPREPCPQHTHTLESASYQLAQKKSRAAERASERGRIDFFNFFFFFYFIERKTEKNRHAEESPGSA